MTSKNAQPSATLAQPTGRGYFILSLLLVAAPTWTLPTAEAQTSCDGTLTWTDITPDCLAPGDRYRILFVTNNGKNARDTDIARYNAFVQTEADGASGNPFNSIEFRALGSTEDVDARDNTRTNPNQHGAGERIFYYRGDKVADNYRDLYDGAWDSQSPRNQQGNTRPFNLVLTGSTSDGTRAMFGVIPTYFGSPTAGTGSPINSGKELFNLSATNRNNSIPLYALSEVLTTPGVPPVVTLSVDDDSVTEGRPFLFRVVVMPPAAENVTVYADTQDITAISGSDYTELMQFAITVPPGQISTQFEIATIDNLGGELSEMFSVNIREGNLAGEAPLPSGVTLGTPASLSLTIEDNDELLMPDVSTQTAVIGTSFTYQFDEVVNPDSRMVTYAAQLDDGSALPEWLDFDARTRTFSGIPSIGDVRNSTIRVTVTDDSSPPQSVHSNFRLEVTAVTGPDQNLMCASPPGVANATIASTGNSLGHTATYTCIAGSDSPDSPETTVCTRIDASTAAFPTPSLTCQLIVPTINSLTVGDEQITVDWSSPGASAGTLTYEVAWSPPRQPTGETTETAALSTHLIAGLTNGVEYTVHITANSNTDSVLSPAMSATPRTVPDAPQITSVNVAGDGLLRVVWEPVTGADNGGAAVTDYQVSWEPPRMDAPTTLAITTDTQYDITGLTIGTAYTVTVAARNAAGFGASAVSAPVTAAQPPDAPQITSVSVAGDGLLRVVWEPVTDANNGGAAVTDYQVSWEPPRMDAPTTLAITAATQYDITGLTGGTAYTVAVAARNAAGFGTGAVSAPVTAITTPGAPQNVSATRGDSEIGVTWNAPTNTGGAAVTAYTVTASDPTAIASPVSHTPAHVGGAEQMQTITITGLMNGVAYEVRVAASNTVGEGPANDNPPVITPAGLPQAPELNEPMPAADAVTLSWQAPTDNGSPITAYQVFWTQETNPPGAPEDRSSDTTAELTYTIAGLERDTVYRVSLRAVNSVGAGIESASTLARTENTVTPPGVPRNLVLTAFNRRIRTNWEAPEETGGVFLLTYTLEWSTGTSVMTDNAVRIEDIDATTFTLENLQNNTPYAVRVSAMNAAGTGNPTPEQTAMPGIRGLNLRLRAFLEGALQ